MSHACHACQHPLHADSRFCLKCGTPVPTGPATAVPDNIGLSTGGRGATSPSAPEPAPTWQPTPVAGPPQQPGPPAGPPPAGPVSYAVPGGPVGPPQFVAVESSPAGGRGAGRIIGIGLGVVGFLAIGFLALRFLLGGSDTGGASSPEAVVKEMVTAINAQDPLAVVSLMAPDELDGFDTLVEDSIGYYRDLGLEALVDEVGGSDDIGVTIELEADRIDVRMEGDRAAIVSFELDGRVEIDGAEDSGLLEDNRFDFSSRDLEGALPNGSDEVELIAVKLGGRWYASPMLTAGHYIVENSDLPPGEYDRIGEDRDPGANSAVEAVDALVDVVNDPDADDLAAALGGGEGRVAVAFRDAIDDGFREIDTGDVRYELSVRTEDLGDGRVELTELELSVRDDFSSGTVTIEDDCVTSREDGERPERECLLDALSIDGADELDTTLFLDTVDEDGGRRVRIVPTLTDVLGRFLRVFDDRQSLLFATDSPQLDEANTVEPGSDIEIDFDGQLYSVNEFQIVAGEAYNVTGSEGTQFDLYVDDGFGLEQKFSDDFVAAEDGVARVVTYSDFDDDEEDCGIAGCFPTGRGEATIRVRQAGRQSVPFPQRITGDFGPGDVRIFELEVETEQTVRIDVHGDFIGSDLIDGFLYRVDDDTYELPAGTHEFVVYNTSGDESTTYDVVPSNG